MQTANENWTICKSFSHKELPMKIFSHMYDVPKLQAVNYIGTRKLSHLWKGVSRKKSFPKPALISQRNEKL